MEKINDIKELEMQYEKIREEIIKTRLLDDDEIEKYRNFSDEEKREKYTDQERKVIDKYIELSDEETQKLEQIKAKAIEAFDMVTDEIKELEEEISKNDKEIQILEAEIKDIKSQIELKEQELKALEAKGDYDQAEYDNLAKEIAELKLKLDEKTKLHDEKKETNNKSKEKLEKLNKEKKQLLEDYGHIIGPHLETKLANVQEQWDAKREEVQAKMKKLAGIKESKEYKDGEEAALKEVKDLDREIAYGVLAKDELASQITEIRRTLNEMEGREVSESKYESLSKRIKDAQERVNAEIENPTEEHNENKEQEQEQALDGEASESDKKDEPKGKEKSKQLSNKGKVYAGGNSVIAPAAESEPNKEQKDKEEKQEKDHKKTFKGLYEKARKGTLSSKDFDELAEIMKDPANYEKYGITTGVVFNKSKSTLIAMAKIVGDTNTLSKEAREKLDLPVEKPNKDNGLMSRYELMEWKGLKELIANPDKKIAAEEQFKKVVAMDRETLTKEQQEVWDKAQSHLSKYAALRGALATYDEVSRQRSQKSKSWFSRTSSAKSPKLPAATNSTAPTKHTGMDFAGKVNPVIDDSTIPPRTTTIDEKGIQK